MKTDGRSGLPERAVTATINPMFRDTHIKMFFAVLAVSVLAQVSSAGTSVRVDAPPPVSVNGEAHAAKPMPKFFPSARTMKITLSLDASPASSAAVTLGKAWQGSLPEPEKVALALGYDRGEWHIRGDRLRKRFTDAAASPSSAGPRALTARVRLGRDGVPVSVSFNSDGLPVVFQGLESDALLSWLDPGGWESVRVTARGGASNVFAEVRYIADGSVIIMR